SYSKFMKGEQDQIFWLEDVKKAFEANHIDNIRKIPVIVPKLKELTSTWWFAQLTQRKQLPGESVNSYYVAVEKMIRRVKAETVSSFIPNTLQVVYERAKAFENTYKQNPTYAAFLEQTPEYPLQVTQYQNNLVSPLISVFNGTNVAINKLTEAVNKINNQTKTIEEQHFYFGIREEDSSIFILAEVQEKVIPLIVDSGSSGSVISSYLLKALEVKIDRPSTINMIMSMKNVKGFYNVLVGNNWFFQVNALIDWDASELTLTWEGKEVIISVEFRKVTPKSLEANRSIKIEQKVIEIEENDEIKEEESEDEKEFEEEELEDRIYKFSELEEEDESFEDDNMYSKNALRNNLGAEEA
ncbi:7300_t:CDS:2, partial [Cetraspora pellucida]